jgi:hypothetical protein
MKAGCVLLLGAGTLFLSGCVDDASFCREPGYLCADHVSEKDNTCVLPGYTCTDHSDDDSRSPITGKRSADPGDGGPE